MGKKKGARPEWRSHAVCAAAFFLHQIFLPFIWDSAWSRDPDRWQNDVQRGRCGMYIEPGTSHSTVIGEPSIILPHMILPLLFKLRIRYRF